MRNKKAKLMRKHARMNRSLLDGPFHMYADDNGKLVIEPVTQAEYDRVYHLVTSSNTSRSHTTLHDMQ